MDRLFNRQDARDPKGRGTFFRAGSCALAGNMVLYSTYVKPV